MFQKLFNHVLLEVKLYETKRGNNWSPIPEDMHYLKLTKAMVVTNEFKTVLNNYISIQLDVYEVFHYPKAGLDPWVHVLDWEPDFTIITSRSIQLDP